MARFRKGRRSLGLNGRTSLLLISKADYHVIHYYLLNVQKRTDEVGLVGSRRALIEVSWSVEAYLFCLVIPLTSKRDVHMCPT